MSRGVLFITTGAHYTKAAADAIQFTVEPLIAAVEEEVCHSCSA